MIRLAVAALLALSTATAAVADVWTAIPSTSEIRFRVSALGGQQTGRFGDWTASIDFEPGRPQDAEVDLTIKAASLVMDNRSLNGMARGDGFLDADDHAEIRFRLTSLTPTGAAHYQAAGQVTVKGRTRTVRFPVDLRITGDTAQMTGGFSLRRADFGIGTSGPWNALTGRDVRVDVTLNARRQP